VKALDLLVARRGDRLLLEHASAAPAARLTSSAPAGPKVGNPSMVRSTPTHPANQRRSVEADRALEITDRERHVINADGS
jgi:hypothetical protein